MKALFITSLLLSNVFATDAFNKRIFEKAVKEIQSRSFYSMSENEIYEAALKGVLKKLESKNRKTDKPSLEDANVLIPPRKVKEMGREMKGEVSGIGIGIKYDTKDGHKYPLVEKVIKGGGAQKAGLKKGDQILKINGTSISDFKSFRDIVYQIRGKSGTAVKLSILRDGETIIKKVKRKKISWDAVEILRYNENGKKFSVIKINYFNEKTVGTLRKELTRMNKNQEKDLVLDLRDNSGGLFDEGLKAIKLFAKKSEQVLKVKYANGKTKKYTADSNGIGKDLSISLLVGKKTKSMGEAFASALKTMKSAKIIGEQSYGKGTMETVLELDNKHSIKFTVGRLFSSNGKTWDKVGVEPDFVLPFEEVSGKDSQLELAKMLIMKK